MQRMPKGNPTKIVIRSTRDISEKKFACDACDRKFFTKKDAKRHMVVHTGNRDFVCSRCPQRFGRKDHLVRHVKKSHNGSLRKPPSMAAVNALGAAVASLLPNNEVTHALSPKRVAHATLKQEPGSYVVMNQEGDLQVAPAKRVASPGSVMSVATIHEEGAESVGDGHNLPGLTASAVNVYESNLLSSDAFNLSSEPDMAALSQTVGESQVPLLSPLQSEMDALVGHVSFYAEEEARHKLRMAQFQKLLAEQYSVVSTPASSPISDIQTKLIRQSGGFVVEAASQAGSPATSSDCDGDSVNNDDAGEFPHDVYCPGSMFPNPLTPVDSIALDAELFVKQDDFLTDLIDEVDPDDYVNTIVASQHLAKIPSGQVSPYELVPDNGNNSWNGFESSPYAVSKEQQMLESRLQELLNNNPFCIPADAPSMLTYLCDLAAESIAMDDSQSSCSSDAVNPGSCGSDCCNMAELPLSSVEKELMDFNQLLEQVCQEEACASPEHVTLAEGNFANEHSENVTVDKPNAAFNEPQPCWFPMGHGNTSSLLFATRENQAAESWFCGRGEMSAEKCFRGCDAGPNELDQVPAWLY